MVARLQQEAFYRTQRQLEISHHPERIGLHRLEVDAITTDSWQLQLYFVEPAPTLPDKQWLPRQLSIAHISLLTTAGTASPLVATTVYMDVTLMCFIINVTQLPDTPPEVLASEFVLELIDIPNLDAELTKLSFFLIKEAPVDLQQVSTLPPQLQLPKAIDYQAKDYNSFRLLMLGQLAQMAPQWQERHAADLGIALVEMLAYTADYLSYYQDAVATESYLGTARRRISLRRHARLVNYTLSEGCNARVWVHITVQTPDETPVCLPTGTPLLTKQPWIQQPPGRLSKERYRQLFHQSGTQIRAFETLENSQLYAAHNTIRFYTAGERTFQLKKGATSAQLEGQVPSLEAGSVLFFEEILSLKTGKPEDADRLRRHPVRLKERAVTSLDGSMTTIHWFSEDALPFNLTVSGYNISGRYLQNVSVARGNIVLADYGTTIADEQLPSVPPDGNYTPPLKFKPLSHGVPYHSVIDKNNPAKQATKQTPTDARPAMRLLEKQQYNRHVLWPPVITLLGEDKPIQQQGNQWLPQPDLLDSGPFDRAFVVETESDDSAYLRFGDGKQGQNPTVNSTFTANYRIGNGKEGNVGLETINYIVTDDQRIVGVRNPMPAHGGVDPEPIEQARMNAPEAFRVEQQRCVTAADFVAAVEKYPGVLSAIAHREWMGSWPIMAIYIDRKGGKQLDATFVDRLTAMLASLKVAGTDFQIFPAKKVSLTIQLTVAESSNIFRAHVHKILQLAFSDAAFPNGEQGFFYPDNFTFGNPLYLSKVITRAMQVEGVEKVTATRFCRYDQPADNEKIADVVTVSPLEIIQVQNIASCPQNGTIQFKVEGGYE